MGIGYCPGQLYDLGRYPGLCIDAPVENWVTGEVYQVLSVAKVLPLLDDYEGCTPRYRQPHEYQRMPLTITLQNNKRLSAWVYVYQGNLQLQQRIASGDYVNYRQTKIVRC